MKAAAGAERRTRRPQTGTAASPQPDATRPSPSPPSTEEPAMPTPRLSSTYTLALSTAAAGRSEKRVSRAWVAKRAAAVILDGNRRRGERLLHRFRHHPA